MTVEVGSTLGPYRIVSELGAGGMGVVYKAEDPRLKRTVAIKLLPPALTKDETAKRRFLQEAQTASALDHPNICNIHEINETDDGRLYLVMAFYDGQTLRERLDAGELPIDEAVGVARQVADGLSVAHESGIVHRDIKPANLLLDKSGAVKILDFGLAKLSGSEGVTQTGTAVGTVAYMSPEQARGEEVDARTDIWSLGAVLYEMVAGKAPFRGDNMLAISSAIAESDPASLGDSRAGVPTPIEEAVRRALSKRKEQRYASARALGATLAQSTDLPASVAVDATPSIAVLPFADMSAKKDQDYFCEGMAEEIINTLSQLDGVRVVARTSAFQFKGQSGDVRKIGEALAVTQVLEGSVRTAGDRLRVTAQLVNVADGYHVWSERYDRRMEDVFDVQDEISAAIAEALKIRLGGNIREPKTERHTDDLDAYHFYLQGRHSWYNRHRGALEKAVRYYEQAIDKDPDYALAHAGVAEAYCIIGFYGFLPPKVAFPKAIASVERALELNPRLSEAYAAQAFVRLCFEWDFEGAIEALDRAVELDPSDELAYGWRGFMLCSLGRQAEALEAGARSIELDPLSPYTNTLAGMVKGFGVVATARDLDGGMEILNGVLERDPDFLLGLYGAGTLEFARSDHERALALFEQAAQLSGRGALYVALLGQAYARAGRRAEAEEIVHELERRSDREYVPSFALAWVLMALGEADRAFECLEQDVRDRGGFLCFVQVAQWFDDFRGDPRFDDVIRRMGFPPLPD